MSRRVGLPGGPTLLALLLLAGCGDGPSLPARSDVAAARATTRPSIVLVSLSGVRTDDVEATPARTPAPLPSLEAFAAGATRFRQAAAAAAWEVPSLATVMTGLIPFDTNVRGRADADRPYLIPPLVTIAETLADQGYATAAFVSGTSITRACALDQGFAEWTEGWALPDGVAAVTAWLAGRSARPDEPFFLFLQADATAPPPPPQTSEEERVAAAIAAHARRMATLERGLAALLDALAPPRLPADAVTILLSDHGAALGERDGHVGRGRGVGDEQIRVPLAIRAPGFPAGPVEGSCGLVDLLPTVRDLLGLPPAEGLGGRSLRPLAKAPAAPGAPILVQEWRRSPTTTGPRDESIYAVRTARAKFVAVFNPRPPSWTEAVYDLVEDPAEVRPLPGDAVAKFGAEFARAVENVRNLLQGRRTHLQDPIVSGYVAGGG